MIRIAAALQSGLSSDLLVQLHSAGPTTQPIGSVLLHNRVEIPPHSERIPASCEGMFEGPRAVDWMR